MFQCETMSDEHDHPASVDETIADGLGADEAVAGLAKGGDLLADSVHPFSNEPRRLSGEHGGWPRPPPPTRQSAAWFEFA